MVNGLHIFSLSAGLIDKHRDVFEKVLEAMMTIKRKKVVILGFAGSGKTHTLALLLHNKLPPKRVSTSCVKTPVRSISLRRLKKSSLSKSCAEISQREFSQRMMTSGKDASPLMSPSSTEKDVDKAVEQDQDEKRDLFHDKQVLRAKAISFRNVHITERVEPLNNENEVVAEITDSGGQPQFLEILPRFISGLAVAIIVTNLSERLDECPTSYFYGKDGELVGKGEPSKITNEQMLCQFLQMVVSQSRGNSEIKFIIVGTHSDLEYRCTETRGEKEKKISDMVKSFDLGDNATYADHKCEKRIFAVNAKHPSEADYEVGQRVMEVVMDEDGAETINISLKFHLLEETLREMSTTGKIAFTVSEIMQSVKKYFNDEKSLKAGLQYLEKSNHIFYFNELFPDKVIGEPQAVLNMVTEIVESHINLSGDIDTGRVMDGLWKKFKEQGILTVKILNKISNGYDPHFTPDDILKLLEKLLILFKRRPGEFLMPCLLSTEVSMPTFENLTADPMHQISMMLHFQKGLARIGIFCSSICKLISGEGWKHYENSNVSRNHFTLTHPDVFGVVCFQDSNDSFFQITLHFPAEVTQALCYHPDEPVLAFECKKCHTPSLSLHPAKYFKGCKSLRCTKDPLISTKLTEWHRLWLGECVPLRVGSAFKSCFLAYLSQVTLYHLV